MPRLNYTSQFKLYANVLWTNLSVLEVFEILKKNSQVFKKKKVLEWVSKWDRKTGNKCTAAE